MADPKPDAVVSNAERIGFRFLLLAWCIGTLLLLASGISYVQWQSTSREVNASLKSFHTCEEKLNAESPTCRIVDGNYVNFDRCMSLRDATCGARSFEAVVERRNVWSDRAELFLYIAVGVLGLPAVLFYVLRWALTGRSRPLWIRP
jgi:hypothetical protein